MPADDAEQPANLAHQQVNDTPLLSFGTQVVVDGRAISAELTNSSELILRFVTALVERIELESSDSEAPLRSLAREFRAGAAANSEAPLIGVSAVAARGETAITTHTFTDLNRVNLRLVSALSVPVDHVISEFRRIFAVGRNRSHVSSRYRTFPTDPERLERFLLGERAYTRLRLDEPLAP